MIKFKCWDESLNEMILPEEVDLYNENGEIVSYYEAGHKHPLYKKGETTKVYTKLLQFTGCLDKNGKEIYEGDVVNGGIYNGSFQYGVITRVGRQFYSIPIGRFSEGFFDQLNQLEVIGNMYENPDLIKTNYN